MRQNRATPELCPDHGSATIARRRLLTAVAAAPVAASLPVATPAVAAVDSNADAPLFALSSRLTEVETTIETLLCALANAERRCGEKKDNHQEPDIATQEIDDIENDISGKWDDYWIIIKDIAAYPVTTTAGILEKLRIFQKATGEWFERDQASLPKGGMIFLNALSDLERMVRG